MTDQVTVVLVTYNSRRILPLALASLAGLPHVTVVDNGSRDGTPALARELMPRAQVIEAGANLGFGRANNLALKQVTTPYALLLNPDCELQPGALAALLAATRRYPQAAIWAPKLYDAPGRLGLCYRPPFYAPQPRELIDPDGDLWFDKEKLGPVSKPSLERMKELIKRAWDAPKDPEGVGKVYLKASRELAYGRVYPVIIAINEMNVQSVDLATNEMKEK